MHIQESLEADLVHHEYLHKEKTDPRRAFAEWLIELCGSDGHIIVYNQSFEIARNNDLATDFPEFAAAIDAINARIIDLLLPFKSRWLYHPDQKSSASIKAVLPAFTDTSYDYLEISHGGDAMLQYAAFVNGNLPDGELAILWENLTEYCKQDTYAMKLLLDVLTKFSLQEER